jgi:hypothetical protein
MTITPQDYLLPETDFSLYRLFPNYAGKVQNKFGSFPLSFMELSKPTGKYVSRLLMREVNILTRRHSVVLIGNSCAPGYFFPQLEPDKGIAQFKRESHDTCGVFVANVPSEAVVSEDAVCFEAEPFMILRLREQWKNFEDYLSAMQSKYRVRAKKVLELSEPLQLEIYDAENLPEAILDSCAVLLHETLKEKTLAMNKNLRGMLQCFAGHFGGRIQFRVYRKNGIVVGFITCTQLGDRMLAWHLGYDASQAKELHIYQRMLYDLVRDAISQGCCSVNFGRTATEIKSTIGAEPMENKFVVYARNPFMRKLLHFYKRRYFKPASYTLRRPFKD